MKRMFLREWNWWKKHNIREQIFLSMLFLTVLGVGVLGIVSYYITKNSIEQNYRQSYETTLKNSSKVLELKLTPIVENVRAVLDDPELKQILNGKQEYSGNKFLLEDQRRLKRITENITLQEKAVNGIAVMDFFGHSYFRSNINIGAYGFYTYYDNHNLAEEDWFAEVSVAAGKEVFFGEGVLGGIDQTGEISFAKVLNDPETGEPMGCMVVNLSNSIFRDAFVKGDEGYETSAYMIVDEKRGDKLVYIDGGNGNTEKIMKAFSENPENSRYVFSKASNGRTGLSFVNVIEKNELSKTSKYLRNLFFLMAGVIGALSFFSARLISNSITNPLKKLEQVIYDVGEGERNISEEFDDSEVGRLGQKFKEMVNTNLELSERLMAGKLNEREAELLLLQSQINPHFLYNTLDSIYCVAMIHGDDQIGEMILALSNNFKLSLNNGEKYMTVDAAVRRIEEYMKLQNIRYNNRFDLQVDVQEDIRPSKVISFILQPFVENAMYHGLEPKIGQGSIRLEGKREGENLVFRIMDDGVGIEDMSRLEKGYGVRNVIERIHLNYGEQYGVTFESEKGKGTTVKIVVPEKPGEL